MNTSSSAAALDAALAPALVQRQSEHLYRQRRSIDSPQGPQVVVAGSVYLNFCSNDYLGLAQHPKVVEAWQQAARRWGVGSGASHLVAGHFQPHHELEEALAAFTGRQRALVFSSGYLANMGVLGALLGRKDAVFQDRLNHASLLDGGLLSGARLYRFRHNDTTSLAQRLSQSSAKRKLVAVDGVFSMDGDLAPLPELAAIARRHNAWLMVDDAHAFGCLGEQGTGSLEASGVDAAEVPILMATLGKALGTAGAFVAGSETLIETLIQYARTYIYTTALPPALAAASLASLQLVQAEPERRQRLQARIHQFTQGAQAIGLPLQPSHTAIQPLLVGDANRALALSQALAQRGFWISAIRPPTVPEGSARLRITLSAAHSPAQVESLLTALDQSWRTLPP